MTTIHTCYDRWSRKSSDTAIGQTRVNLIQEHLVFSRRHFLRASAGLMGAMRVLSGMATTFASASPAGAQGRGSDRGGGNGGGNGGGGGNGSSGGNGDGNGKGSGGGKDSGGRSNGSGASGSSRSKGEGTGSGPGRAPSGASSSLSVTHRTGIKETIMRGRYIMRDKWGRIIIARKATSADRNRLRSLID